MHVPDARITLFGFEPEPAELEVRPRTRAWRLRRTLTAAAATAVAAPLAFLVPPHAPWGLGVLALGSLLAYRRWQEAFTVTELRGACPACGAELGLPQGVRLRHPHRLHCESCNHEPLLLSDPSPEGED